MYLYWDLCQECARLPRDSGQIRGGDKSETVTVLPWDLIFNSTPLQSQLIWSESLRFHTYYPVNSGSRGRRMLTLWSKQTFSHVLIIREKKVNPYLLNMAGLQILLKLSLTPIAEAPLIGFNLVFIGWNEILLAWQKFQSLKRLY